jgi:hypothetical protein
MNIASFRTVGTLLLALCIPAAPLFTACVAEPDAPVIGVAPAGEVVVTAYDVEALPPGEDLVADLRASDYWFDGSLQAEHFERIRLLAADGSSMRMTDWILYAEQRTGHALPRSGFSVRGSLDQQVSGGSPGDGIGESKQEARNIKCSDDGCLCLVCYYDQDGLVYCDVYWLCGG